METPPESGGETAGGSVPPLPQTGPVSTDRSEIKAENLPGQPMPESAERKAFLAGAAAARQEQETSRLIEEGQLLSAIEAIQQEAALCLSRLEPEVIALILEVAKKVLGHEAQIDRLFLAGAVRLMLERMQESAEVVLHVAAGEDGLWRSFFASTAWKVKQLRIEADAGVEPGMCTCRSGAAVLDFSVKAQLGEIGRRFQTLIAPETTTQSGGGNKATASVLSGSGNEGI